jgi:predicted phage terminase large subunit-like protein
LKNLLAKSTEEIQEELQREKARRYLIDFTTYTKNDYQVGWHHRKYAAILDKFSKGKIQKLMVFMPPQHGKSELCSRRLPAFMLGNSPNLRIAVVSYNHTFASKFNRDIQHVIDSDEYRQLYPGTLLTGKGVKSDLTRLRNTDEFEVVGHRGSLVSVGVGGGLTGRTLDVGIIDDVYKDAESAWSPTVRGSVQDWYDSVFRTRLHNDSQQLITLTRWHPDDLPGEILKRESEKWTVVVFPALKIGPQTEEDPRAEGEPLWPEWHSLERLLEIKKQNPHIFGSLFQQDPKPVEGLLFPLESLNRFTLKEINLSEDTYFQRTFVAVVDLADKGSDYYCMLVAVLLQRKIYVVDVIFTQAPIEKTEPLTLAMLQKYKPTKCRIESNAGGELYCKSLRQEMLKMRLMTHLDPVFTTANKMTRILLSSGAVKEHMYFRSDYTHNSDYAKFMDNLSNFTIQGKNAHDDGPDAATMLIEMLSNGAFKFASGLN